MYFTLRSLTEWFTAVFERIFIVVDALEIVKIDMSRRNPPLTNTCTARDKFTTCATSTYIKALKKFV